jgi:hypothetical protein
MASTTMAASVVEQAMISSLALEPAPAMAMMALASTTVTASVDFFKNKKNGQENLSSALHG